MRLPSRRNEGAGDRVIYRSLFATEGSRQQILLALVPEQHAAVIAPELANKRGRRQSATA
jgi:hypothetical protein